ncbi:PAS domain-containing protein [uncultured Brevundimonas sp.]|uniref:PAS domain-containing protein n=1 Tax=uncultured Brevundimonas sp. TaxID=213418 RepID=UPI0030ECDF1B|tara:strand:+ start:2388 stop:2915 length:528 start_codon:yes stop_codon:yes gene_type:complete
MFHSDTQTLIDHWTLLAEGTAIPARAAFDPTRLGLLLPRTFMAARHEGDAVFRLAGGWIERFHGRPLGNTGWLPLWNADSRALVAESIARTFREARPVIIVAEAGDVEAPLEIVLAPLRGPDGVPDRLLGLYVPATAEGRELVEVESLKARVAVGVGEVRRAPLSLAAVDGRRIA